MKNLEKTSGKQLHSLCKPKLIEKELRQQLFLRIVWWILNIKTKRNKRTLMSIIKYLYPTLELHLTMNWISRGGSRTAATSKMERFVIIVNGWKRFVIIVNGWKPLTIFIKRSILDVAAALDPPLISMDLVKLLIW